MESFSYSREQILDAGTVFTRRLIELCIDFFSVLCCLFNVNFFSLRVIDFRRNYCEHQLACIGLLLKFVDPVLETFERFKLRGVVN